MIVFTSSSCNSQLKGLAGVGPVWKLEQLDTHWLFFKFKNKPKQPVFKVAIYIFYFLIFQCPAYLSCFQSRRVKKSWAEKTARIQDCKQYYFIVKLTEKVVLVSKNYFEQHTACWAPVCWLKNTTQMLQNQKVPFKQAIFLYRFHDCRSMVVFPNQEAKTSDGCSILFDT